MDLRKQGHIGSPKVKSGCRTCKIRKIKCDEGRPACNRCLSTGRACDGYGIWGGGSNSYEQPFSSRYYAASIRLKGPALVEAKSAAEHDSLQWFIIRTATKLPGVFESSFWDTLVYQATCSEPAVLHAVLALSSVHRRESINYGFPKRDEVVPDAQEQFTLQQYNKAIHQLQPHFFTRTKSSMRVALITCVVFICLEFLRGRYDVGNKHLQNGMKLLNEIVADSGNTSYSANSLSPFLEHTDDWLIDVLARLNLQAALFGQGSQRFDIIPQRFNSRPLPVIFTSMRQARTSLDKLMNRILRLTEKSRQQDLPPGCSYSTQLLDSQQCVQADLGSWFQIYLVSRVHLQADKGIMGIIAYKMLRLHHTMAKIMSEVCLHLEDESCFDTHTDGFVALIKHSIDLSHTILSTDLSNTPFDHALGISPFVADFGWIPPLYYTAIKCRIHRIRLQAIRLLRSVMSKEGIWDAGFVASIAQEVMRIEERDSYSSASSGDNFPLHSPPSEQDLAVLSVLKANRIHGLRVLLPINSTENTILTGRHKKKDGTWEVLRREFDAYSQR